MGFASLLIPILLIALVVVLVRKASERGEGGDGHGIRRFFQYLLLYGLLIVVALGLSILLNRVFPVSALIDRSARDLARGLTFTLVGGPLYYGVAVWSWRHLRRDPAEARSLGWAFYSTVATLTALIVTMVSLYQVLAWLAGVNEFDSRSLARFLVWGVIWAVHYYFDGRMTPPERSRLHRLAGSLAGLGTAAAGLARLITAVLELVLGFERELIGGEGLLWRPAITLGVGALVWWLYWIRSASRMEPSPLWYGYLLLAGVGGGLITAISSAAVITYNVLVWFFGEPRLNEAARHFAGVPAAVGGLVVGGLVWWYHRATLETVGGGERTEAARIYEYLMAGIGLLTAAAGLTAILVAFLEAVTGSAGDVGPGAINTLLTAVTMLVVGGPVWWIFWRRIQAGVAAGVAEERSSPTRRVYLFVLFGVGGVAAVITLLAGVYIVFEAVVEGRFGMETIRSLRFALGTLVTTGAIAAYHWQVYRGERERVASRRYPQRVILVGPVTGELATELGRRTHSRVEAWKTSGEEAGWDIDELTTLLENGNGAVVVVVAGDEGPRAVPVSRPS